MEEDFLCQIHILKSGSSDKIIELLKIKTRFMILFVYFNLDDLYEH